MKKHLICVSKECKEKCKAIVSYQAFLTRCIMFNEDYIKKNNITVKWVNTK